MSGSGFQGRSNSISSSGSNISAVSTRATVGSMTGGSTSQEEFGTTTFVHGMHAFNSGSQLQHYLDQIAGSGNRATITEVMHLDMNPSSNRNGTPLNSGPSGQPGSGFNLGREHYNSSFFSHNSQGSPGPSAPVHYGGGMPIARRRGERSIVMFCELHGPQNSSSADIPTNDPTESRNSSRRSRNQRGLHVAYCEICQGWMAATGNGENTVVLR